MKKLIYALRFMTVIPIPWKEGEDMKEVAQSIAFFPLVGLIIGLSNLGVFYLGQLLFSPFLCAVLVVVWWVVITGGLHLDGMADTADGVWGGTTADRRLEIMKDSRTGVFGVLTLLCFILLKTGALNELFAYYGESKYRALVTAPLVGRWISVFSIFVFNSARKEGLGVFFKENTGRREFLIAAVLSAVLIFLSGGLAGLAAMASATVLSFAASSFFNRKLGGLTGDTYGALCEGSEFVSLMVMIPL